MTELDILNGAMQLPDKQRAFIAEKLIESLDAEVWETPGPEGEFVISPEWMAEIERRVREIDAGTARMIPSDEVFKRSYEKYQ